MRDNFNDFGDDDFFGGKFNGFSREELEKLFRQRMADDEFRKRFIGLIGNYQRDFDNMMKYLSMGRMFDNPFKSMMGDMPLDENMKTDSDGWQHWTSPDGSYSISSFTRFDSEDPFKTQEEENLPDDYVLKMLEAKLTTAVEEERYEDASELKTAIDDLKNKNEEKN